MEMYTAQGISVDVNLRWLDRLKYDDVQEKCTFSKNIRFKALQHL